MLQNNNRHNHHAQPKAYNPNPNLYGTAWEEKNPFAELLVSYWANIELGSIILCAMAVKHGRNKTLGEYCMYCT